MTAKGKIKIELTQDQADMVASLITSTVEDNPTWQDRADALCKIWDTVKDAIRAHNHKGKKEPTTPAMSNQMIGMFTRSIHRIAVSDNILRERSLNVQEQLKMDAAITLRETIIALCPRLAYLTFFYNHTGELWTWFDGSNTNTGGEYKTVAQAVATLTTYLREILAE